MAPGSAGGCEDGLVAVSSLPADPPQCPYVYARTDGHSYCQQAAGDAGDQAA